METQVVMKRPLFGIEISQQSKTEFLSASELAKAGNKWRALNELPLFDLNDWFQLEGTKEFMKELENKFGKIKSVSYGRNAQVWVHPLLFIDIALAIHPKLKIEVYTWLYDYLIKYRNKSGDSFIKMRGALYFRMTNKSEFEKYIKTVALRIQQACSLQHVNDWQRATENQLKLRDKIHNNIELLCNVLKNNEQAVRIGIEKALEDESAK